MTADDIAYPRELFNALIHGNSPYAFYIFQWVPYQTDAKRNRLKMLHDVKTFDGREAHSIWPNGSSCGPFKDEEVEFIRISKDQFGTVWKGKPTPVVPPRFPTVLRKMWSGGEVQDWIDQNITPLLRQHDPYDRHEVRDILRVLQEGEMTVSRAMECIAGVVAGTFTYEWLPPMTAVFGMDDIPADVVRALQAEIAKALAIQQQEPIMEILEDMPQRHRYAALCKLGTMPPAGTKLYAQPIDPTGGTL